MTTPSLETLFAELGLDVFVEEAREASVARLLAALPVDDAVQDRPGRLPRYAFLFESQGIASFARALATRSEDDFKDCRKKFSASFYCWRAIATLDGDSSQLASQISSAGQSVVAEELLEESLAPQVTIAFRLAVSGLLAERNSETRLELRRFTPPEVAAGATWHDRVLTDVATSLVLLVRKERGWSDVDEALKRVESLRTLQREYEGAYLSEAGGGTDQTFAAFELVGLYHLAQLITITGTYLRDGAEGVQQVQGRLDRHRERSGDAFAAGRSAILRHISDLLWAACRELVRNSLWTHVRGLGQSMEQFARVLTERGRPYPVLELWPSQQEALRKNLLNPYPRAVLVEMPTSAGKTLLAKFAIVQAKALNEKATIVYLVPTRALVNQITLDLRADFGRLNWTVEQAVPAFELDPVEEQLLADVSDVLVATPEKLDLLIRRDHPVARNISLVVADEAHNLRDGQRGARLELLLGMIKRDRPDSRFLLLSPFLPNGAEIAQWLGDERTLDPIVVDWKPSSTLVGTVSGAGKQANRALVFETLAASANVGLREGVRVPIAEYVGGKNTKEAITAATVVAVRPRGAVLVLCEGPGSATTQADGLRRILPERPRTPELEAVIHYLEAELGRSSRLTACLGRGVAFHHSGLSQEARWLIEGLIRLRQVDVVCGTTTLAQGVNFPISTVIVESLLKGKGKLTHEDFWNIAGRAGRALIDTIGVVAFPSRHATDREAYQEFLRDEARAISSQLATLIDQADEIANNFGINVLFKWPQLGPFLQFLAHAMRVSGGKDLAEDVEDLLRASLVFHQARRSGGDAPRRLVQICQAYLAQLKGKEGLVALADQTGFSTPSVLQLQARLQSSSPDLRDVRAWAPDRLFGDDPTPLAARIQAIGQLPEMRLGPELGGTFNPRWIAQILVDWTRGTTIDALAAKYMPGPRDRPIDPELRAATFSKYLFGKLIGLASWGLGALESVSLAGQADADPSSAVEAAYVPSMVFFGVRRKEAVWLRMVGVPRVVANGLGTLWAQSEAGQPTSYKQLRNWVSDLTDAQWSAALPKRSPLTPGDLRLIWREFAGAPAA